MGVSVTDFLYDMRKKGWKLAGNIFEEKPLHPLELKLVFFLRFYEQRGLSNKKLIARAKRMEADLGQRQAEYFLEHQEDIPSKWRKFDLLFPGTVWQRRSGDFCFPFLRWGSFRSREEQWELHFAYLSGSSGPNARLLRRK